MLDPSNVEALSAKGRVFCLVATPQEILSRIEGDKEHQLSAGDFVFVCPDEEHQFRNPSGAPLKFLCLVPEAAFDQRAPVKPIMTGRD